MSGKFALIIGNTEYTDSGLAQLSAPGKDAEDFARVLRDQEIAAFDEVNILLNQPEYVVREAIDDFFNQKIPDDLLVLYFSGHGVRDELGTLYLAVKNTNRQKLKSTGIKSDYIREAMDQSRSKRQVLILDCCNSGAFAQGTKAATGVSFGTASAFEGGYGRIILTASDSTQFAWEGDKVIGETDNSLFTHYLVEGLEGEADLDSDGRITVDELYDYAYEKVKLATPKQTPSKFSTKQQGEIVLRQFTHIEDIKPVSLSEQLVSEIESVYPELRLRAVDQLAKLLNGKNLGLARSAHEALEKITADDDSRRVVQAATQALEFFHQVEQKVEAERKAKEEAERLAFLEAEKAEAERKAKEEAEKLARAQAQQEVAEREAMRLKAEREATEKAAREAAEKVAKERAEKEIAEREAARLAAESEAAREKAEHEAALKAEREAAKLAARKKAEREAAQKAENEAMELAARRKAEREAIEEADRLMTEEKAEGEYITKAEATRQNLLNRFIYKIKNTSATKYDALYWYISLVSAAGILISSGVVQNLDPSWGIGRYFTYFFYEKFLSKNFIDIFLGKYVIVGLYCVGVIFQAWLIAKYKSIIGVVWLITAFISPAVLINYVAPYRRISGSYQFVPIIGNEKWYPYLGYYTWFLLIIWIVIVPLFMIIWNRRK